MNALAKFVLGSLVMLGALSPQPTIAADRPAVPLERAIYRDLRGRVVDAGTGQPVVGVVVSLLYEMAVSDSQGRFVFEKVPLTHGAQISVRVRNRSDILIGCVTLDVPVRFYPLAANWEETIEAVRTSLAESYEPGVGVRLGTGALLVSARGSCCAATRRG